MLFRLILLFLAVVLLAFASLTTVRVPVAVNWRLALLAGEFGHWFVLLPVVVGALAWWTRGPNVATAGVTVVFCVVAAGLLLKPSWQATTIARTLPAVLPESWRAVAPAGPPFSLSTLFTGSIPSAVLAESRSFGPQLRLDYYRPTRSTGPVPCVVVIHGGGWDSGDPSQLPGFNHWLVAKGYAVAAISYRLAPAHPWPAQRDDTLAALAYLKANANELGLDPTRFVLFGRSAGGQIAAAVGYTAKDPSIRGVIALYAPHDMRFVWSISRDDDALNSLKLMTQYLGGPPTPERTEIYDTASAQVNVHRGHTPPTLLVHGVIDTLVWQRHSERLSARLAEEGVPHYHLALPWAVHALEYNLNGPAGQLTAYAVEAFLAANLVPRNERDRRAE